MRPVATVHSYVASTYHFASCFTTLYVAIIVFEGASPHKYSGSEISYRLLLVDPFQ